MRKSALYLLGLVVACLVALGLVVLFSASEAKSLGLIGKPWYFVSRQVIYICFGLVLATGLAWIDYRRWRDNWSLTAVFGVVIFILLWAVFLFPAVKGSHRWIPLGLINFQPGEFAKLLTVLAVSVCLDKAMWKVELFKRGALMPAGLIACFAVPVLCEPDFGSVMVIGAVGFMLMFIAGTRFWHIILLALPALVGVVWEIFHNPNRMARLMAFFGHVAEESEGAVAQAAQSGAWQTKMSIVAINRGGLYGVGLGHSMQKQAYLPEAWTDFIFSVGAEELGLFYTLGVILLFLSFFGLSVYIARKAPDRFGRLLVMGMAFIIFFQAMFNLGVVCAAFPAKGMALPFFSFGGTNMISSFFAVGMIFSVGRAALKDQQTGRPFNRKPKTQQV